MSEQKIQHRTAGLTELGWNYPEIENFGDLRANDEVEWVDDATKRQMSKPAFGYGEGPFKISAIRRSPGKETPGAEPIAGDYYFEIKTPKGIALLSAKHFRGELSLFRVLV